MGTRLRVGDETLKTPHRLRIYTNDFSRQLSRQLRHLYIRGIFTTWLLVR